MPVEPMLAAAVTDLPAGAALPGGCWYEPKFDGYRALVFTGAAGARVQSRNGHDITRAFADISTAAQSAVGPGTVLDGELVIWGDGGLDFAALQQRLAAGRTAGSLARTRPANYLVFDILAVGGVDVRGRPLTERRELLEQALGQANPPLQLVPFTTDVNQARVWLADYTDARVGIEGLVVKGAGSRYEPGRRGWVKYRIRDTVEAIVGAVTGTTTSPTRLVLGRLDSSGGLIIAGATTPLDARQRHAVSSHLRLAGTHPWPVTIGSGRVGHWGGEPVPVTRVVPSLVVEVSADTAVERGRWRHAVRFVRTRPDLNPEDVALLDVR